MKCLILFAILSVSLAALARAEDHKTVWARISAEVRPAPDVSPAAVFEDLKKLHQESFGEPEEQAEIKLLLDLHELNEAHCNKEFMSQVNLLKIKYIVNRQKHLLDYLRKFLVRQFKQCWRLMDEGEYLTLWSLYSP